MKARLPEVFALTCVGALASIGCSHAGTSHGVATTAAKASAPPDPVEVLEAWENAVRSRTDFANVPASDVAFGPDPYAIRAVPESPVAGAPEDARTPSFLGVLRGAGALVALDGALREVARLPAPGSPGGLAVSNDGDAFVVGEFSPRVARYRFAGGRVAPAGGIDLDGVRAMRDVAVGPEGVVYVVEEHDGRLITFRPPRGSASTPELRVDQALCRGPVRVARAGGFVAVDCVLDHAIVIRPVDERGIPWPGGEVRIVHDGPMWGMDAVARGGSLWVAAGGVENHPLDRTQGSFGFVDSFVWLYEVRDGQALQRGEVNASELGLVTPKALKLLLREGAGPVVTVAAFGSDRMARMEWAGADLAGPTQVTTQPVPPGSASIVEAPGSGWAIANPLLDAWVTVRSAGSPPFTVVAVAETGEAPRPIDVRLGEALFFTTAMAPWNKSEGRLSRFTCETCHFEGYVDGRTHYTGRADVHATTKPLLGLFNNRPHFSRALDPDLATMVNNEFRVAGARSDHDSWFSLRVADFPWMRHLGLDDEVLAPERLRASLMAFFMRFTHRPNPASMGRSAFTDVERAGARVFQRRCEGCHQARLVADDASSRVPFERWEPLLFAPAAPIVWASNDYARTGVVPYVNEQGARVVSLRRLYKKYPYFTNGSAKNLTEVLDRAGFDDRQFFHEGSLDGAGRLGRAEKDELRAFLELL